MISIIIPIYNVEKYLPKCIDSLINQTYRNIEIILVVDGSPDNCSQICKQYAKMDNRIIVINQDNAGVSAARNAGLNVAQGEFIGFVDPDDWVEPEMYEGMLKAIQEKKSDLAICGYNYYDEQGKVDIKRLYKDNQTEFIKQEEVMYRFFDMPPTVRHGVVNKLFRTSILNDIRFLEGLHSSEDVFFLCEYVNKINNAVVIHKPYYCNLVRNGSATHGGLSIESLAESFNAHDRMYIDAIRLYPKLKRHAQAFLLDVCTLKYNESKRKLDNLTNDQKNKVNIRIKEMKKYIKKNAFKAIFNREIYWKTRVMYLLIK